MKTETIYADGKPIVTFTKGFKTREQFGKALADVGFYATKANVKYEYWKTVSKGLFKKTRGTATNSFPVTVARW